MNPGRHLPVPYLKIDRGLQIVEQSDAASERFYHCSNLLEIVEEGSKEKAALFLQPSYSNMVIELNFMLADSPYCLFDVYQRWEDEHTAHLILIEKQAHLQNIQYAVQELREQVAYMEKPATPRNSRDRINTLSLLDPAASKGREPSSGMRSSRQHAASEIAHALDTVRELVGILRPDLLEAGKDLYVNLIIDQLDHAMESLGKQ